MIGFSVPQRFDVQRQDPSGWWMTQVSDQWLRVLWDGTCLQTLSQDRIVSPPEFTADWCACLLCTFFLYVCVLRCWLS
jgi:hypothetical protein